MTLVLAFFAFGCQGLPDLTLEEGCVTAAPEAGELHVQGVVCSAQLLADGDGSGADVMLANAWFRAIIRHPQNALTVANFGGGTVVDAAPWGVGDGLFEVIPVVDGGWLDVDTFTRDGDGVTVGGVRIGATDGARGEIRWTADPEGPWLIAEGADGFWLHGHGDQPLIDGRLWGDAVYGGEAAASADLGGVVYVEGDRLLIGTPEHAWTALGGATTRLSGDAPGADHVVVLGDAGVLGRVPVSGAFSLDVPESATGVYAEAAGRAASPVVPIGENLRLTVGSVGDVLVALRWDGSPRPLTATWEGGEAVLGPAGGVLTPGAGSWTLTLEGGPTVAPVVVPMNVGVGGTTPLWVDVKRTWEPGDTVAVAIGLPGDGDRHWRGTDTHAVARGVAAGVDYAVVAPIGDVGHSAESLGLRLRNGSTAVIAAGSVTAWPWVADSRQGGHGALDATQLSLAETLAVSAGGATTNRITLVEGIGGLGTPRSVSPSPDAVRLPPPDADLANYADWFAWLNAGIPVSPVGPLTWAAVVDRDLWGDVDVERALIRGNTVATTGPLVRLNVGGVPPGETAETLAGQIDVAGGVPERLGIVVDGVFLAADGAFVLPETAHWVVGVAWFADGWAVTGPVWLNPRS